MAVVLKTLAFLFVLSFETMAATTDASSSFSFDGFVKSPGFDKNVALFGDSKLVSGGGGSVIQLTGSVSRSQGRVLYMKPIKLFQAKGRNFTGSLSTSFSFSMMSSEEIGSVLAFVMVPSGLDLKFFGRKDNTSSPLGFLLHKQIVAVEFGISKRGNRVGILVGRPESAKVRRNLSSFFDGHFSGGKRLNCWVDYEASSKRIEVRLSLSNAALKPVDPFVSYSVDLAKIWKEEKFMVGLTSANGNSSEPHYLNSWSFNFRHPSIRIHSQPLDPNTVSKSVEEEEKTVEVKGKKSKCIFWRKLALFILGVVCGSLGALLASHLWTICGNRRSVAVVPEDRVTEKSNLVVVKAAAVADEQDKKK